MFGGPPRPASVAAKDGLYTEAVITRVNIAKAMIVIVFFVFHSYLLFD
jgi:hypothetical protein